MIIGEGPTDRFTVTQVEIEGDGVHGVKAAVTLTSGDDGLYGSAAVDLLHPNMRKALTEWLGCVETPSRQDGVRP